MAHRCTHFNNGQLTDVDQRSVDNRMPDNRRWFKNGCLSRQEQEGVNPDPVFRNYVATLGDRLGVNTVGERRALVLFDGLCRLCQIFCHFVVERDHHRTIMFAPLQSTLGQEVLQNFGFPKDLDSVVLYRNGDAYIKSDAALSVLGILQPPWSALNHLNWIPRRLRDFGYEIVAKNRYNLLGHRLVGKSDETALTERLLDTWTPTEGDLEHVCGS